MTSEASTPDGRPELSEEQKIAQLRLLGQAAVLEWLADSYAFLHSISLLPIRSRAEKAMKDGFSTHRQECLDLATDLEATPLPPDQARLQASTYREAFDEAARVVEKALRISLD